jgi:hypothetical protein
MKINSLRSAKNLGTGARRALVALTAAGAIGGLALAAPAAASAATQSSAQATVSYGELAQFHCSYSYGQVTFDYLNMPAGYGATYYQPVVFQWYGGTWRTYAYLPSQYLASYYQVPEERPESINVAHGYYYAIVVAVATAGHVAHSDPAMVDSGAGAGGSYCLA